MAVAGSIGKTSTKLMLAKILEQEKNVAYMDDSYNSGLGLYLSVFCLKVPTRKTGWPGLFFAALGRFFQAPPDILLLEYGIDYPGDMDELLAFARPHVAVLTAVAPEHMEYLKDMETVGREETKILHAVKDFGVVNGVDVDEVYLQGLDESRLFRYGNTVDAAHHTVREWTTKGAVVDMVVEGATFSAQQLRIISEPLIRQLTGAALTARKLGVSEKAIERGVGLVEPAASRMRLLEGAHDSTIIDDTANFSPKAGIAALEALKRLPAKRHIAVLGNMHELGEYETKGFSDVSQEFKGLDTLVFVGDLAKKYFGSYAKKQGFKQDKDLFFFETSVTAGVFVADILKKGDVVLVKGPFGGLYMEEAVKKLLKNPKDNKLLTRQSDFWIRRKRKLFGAENIAQ